MSCLLHLRVNGEVGALGATILDRCYKSAEFRDGDKFCTFVGPRDPDNQGNLTSFDDPFLNIANQSVKGIDINARLATGLRGGNLSANLSATRMLSQKFQPFAELDPQQFNGRLGNHGVSGGPKLTSRLDLRYMTNDDRWSFSYRIDYTGKMDSQDDLAPEPIPFRGTLVIPDLIAEAYWRHGVTVQYSWPDIGQITFGISNLFDAKVPEIGSHGTGIRDRRPTIGNAFNYSIYNYYGRSAFMSVSREF